MKALFIGGTGTISLAVSQLLLEQEHELTLINRGTHNQELRAAGGRLRKIVADINDEQTVAEQLRDNDYDVVADFIAFEPAQLQRDHRLFAGKCGQFIYISSASAYQKPPTGYEITESTPLCNPYWDYSRNKIAGEEFLMQKYRCEGFPITIVRPSHTYGKKSVPVGVHGKNGSWQVIRRMKEGRPVVVPGDGTSLWTLTHTSDFARAFVGLMGNVHAIGEAVQITGDEYLTWNQIYTIIAEALHVKPLLLHVPSDFMAQCSELDFTGSLIGDKANSAVFRNDKLKRLVPGFTAVKRFDQGVREALAYIAAHPECQKEDPEFDAWCDRLAGARAAALRYMKAE